METDWFGDDAPKPWTLADIYADLCSTTDIPRVLNVSVSRVNHWIQRREKTKCPVPVRTLGGIHVYSAEEWRGWFAVWEKRAGPRWTENAMTYFEWQQARMKSTIADE